MLTFGLALVLATFSVALFPCWPYSRQWGYVPCTSTALLLFFVAVIAAGVRPAAGHSHRADTANAPPAVATQADREPGAISDVRPGRHPAS